MKKAKKYKEPKKPIRTLEYYLDHPFVIVTPKKGDDFQFEFFGEVTGGRNGHVTVRDGDDMFIEVDFDQLESIL